MSWAWIFTEGKPASRINRSNSNLMCWKTRIMKWMSVKCSKGQGGIKIGLVPANSIALEFHSPEVVSVFYLPAKVCRSAHLLG